MDSRFPTHYLTDRRVERLTDKQHRLFVTGTAWSVSNRTDGVIEHEDFDSVVFSRFNLEDIAGLVSAGLWAVTPTGWIITDYQQTQTSAAQFEAALETRREADRRRQQRKRAAEKEAPSEGKSRGQSRDSHVTFGGEERQGEERQGKASLYVSTEQLTPDLASLPATGSKPCDDCWFGTCSVHGQQKARATA